MFLITGHCLEMYVNAIDYMSVHEDFAFIVNHLAIRILDLQMLQGGSVFSVSEDATTETCYRSWFELFLFLAVLRLANLVIRRNKIWQGKIPLFKTGRRIS